MLDLKDLLCLSALARHRHFARAARECGMSQPAFSMRIRRLEQRLETAIVRRGNRFEGLTAEGETIVRHARKILDDVKGLEQEFRSARGEITGKLSLGVIPTAAAHAGRLAAELRRGFPGISMRIETTSSLAIQQGIEHGQFDAGITYSEGVTRDLMRVEPLYDEGYVLLAPESLVDGRSGTIMWEEAAELPLCLLEPSMQNRRILDRVFEEVGVLPNVVVEASEFTTALVTVIEGLSATVLPKVLFDRLGTLAGTVAMPLVDPVVEKSVCLATSQRSRDLPTVEALRQTIWRDRDNIS